MGASASREKFRESVHALIEVDVSPDDAEFWDELWKIPSSAEEVFELISAENARKLRDERFDNLATLFTQATAQLCQIVETPYNIYFDQALNCVRVLTRILPFLLEKGDLGDADENVEHLCWGTAASPLQGNATAIPGNALKGSDEKLGMVVGKHASGDDDSQISNDGLKKNDTAGSAADDGDDEQEPLALLVVHAAMHMLFLPQFTCDFYEENDTTHKLNQEEAMDAIIAKREKDKEEQRQTKESKEKDTKDDKKKDNFDDRELRTEAGLGTIKNVDYGIVLRPRPSSIVWAAGSGVTSSELGFDGSTRKYDKNRIEVLRLLLAALCDPLFAPADEYNPLASRWLAVAVAADAPNAICLFYSLLNTVLSYDPSSSGASMPGFSDAGGENTHVRLVELSAQVLCVLLDCGLPGNPEIVQNRQTKEPVIEFDVASKSGYNMFRTLLARIDTSAELSFIYNGFVRLLNNVYESKISYIPVPGASSVKLECFQELLVLLWKFLEENPMFMNHILTNCDINQLIVPICYLMYQSRRDPSQIGLVHICTFVLLKLSGERSFGVSLGKAFTTKLPCDLPLFSGSHTDLVAITLHKLIVNGAYKLVPLYSCFLTIICNISPYWRRMSLVAAVKMVNLFELFSSPKFLYSGEHAHRHLALLLEVFNNVIQYQYNGNQHLVYAIIRRKDSFGRLASITLQRAQHQCHKVYGDHTTVTYDADGAKSAAAGDATSVKTGRGEDNVEGTKTAPGAGVRSGLPGDDQSSIAGMPFQPTDEWLSELKSSLPLETVTRLLQHLVPVVDQIVQNKNGVVDENEILDVLKEVTMVGLLPVPHAIVIRKYQPNQFTALWFTAFMWGVIFLRNQSLPLFDGHSIELFQVSVQDDDE